MPSLWQTNHVPKGVNILFQQGPCDNMVEDRQSGKVPHAWGPRSDLRLWQLQRFWHLRRYHPISNTKAHTSNLLLTGWRTGGGGRSGGRPKTEHCNSDIKNWFFPMKICTMHVYAYVCIYIYTHTSSLSVRNMNNVCAQKMKEKLEAGGWMTKASGVGERRKGRGELRRDCHHRVAALFVPTRMQQWYMIYDI